MFKWLGSLVDSNEKEIKRIQPLVDDINALEPEFKALGDDGLRAKTQEFRDELARGTAETGQRLAEAQQQLADARKSINEAKDPFERQQAENRSKAIQGQIDQLEKEKRETEAKLLDGLLPEAFAAVREAARRTINQRHFDVQLMGGIVLHQGRIAEMKTGEGKTLVATLPLYLNSLTGKGCHLATVNDYLARRDPYWMGPVFDKLGVRVASIYPQQTPDEYAPARLFDPVFDSGDKRWPHFKPVTRKEAYLADITYGTSSEFGFDYLRDNMVIELSQCVQRELNYAIVDEVDNLLIDEARTPLIISGQAEEPISNYAIFAKLMSRLQQEQDYTIDAKERSVNLTDAGITNMERMLKTQGLLKAPNLYDPSNYAMTRYLDSALKAHALYHLDKDYVVKDGQVIIVDEFTGRLMIGRRYSEGLHQAIEAKEGVKVQQETRTFATITIQNYFRMYHKLGGMTGTAATEAEEFSKIYKLEVVQIPTNRDMVREDSPDQIYKDEQAKFKAVVKEIDEMHKKERPVLIGTVSIERSEHLSEHLTRKGIQHQVLNAKQHEKEAGIIAQAGRPGAVTVATNMAGRGVDIILGGTPPDYQPEQDIDEYSRKRILAFSQELPSELSSRKREIEERISNKVTQIAEAKQTLVSATQAYRAEYESYTREIEEALNLRKGGDQNDEYEKHKEQLEENIERKLDDVRAARNALQQHLKSYNEIIDTVLGELKDRAKVPGLRLSDDRLVDFSAKIEEFDQWRKRRLKVVELGGLHIIGTERHEARRIDNQLRGRAGRQGDPGSSRFYVSLEDDIVKRFGGDRIKGFMEWVGMDEDTPIENALVNRSIESAQTRVEGYHFDVRKQLVEYDDVVNKQREIIYAERRKILGGADLKTNILDMVKQEIGRIVAAHTSGLDRDTQGLINDVVAILPLPPDLNATALERMKPKDIGDKLIEAAQSLYEQHEKDFGPENMRMLERIVMLRIIDNLWIEHLTAMEHMRLEAGWQTLRQVRAVDAYKSEGYKQFDLLLTTIQHDVVHTIFHVAIKKEAAPQKVTSPMAQAAGRPASNRPQPAKVGSKKVGRNDPCPCGSGKKYKHCCGK